MAEIDLNKLTPEEKAALVKQIEAEQKKEALEKEANKDAYKELSQEYVKNNIDNLINHNSLTENLIKKLFDEYNVIKKLKASVYGDKQQDSHTSTLSDGSASITIGYNVSIGFDGTETSGVEKIKDFIKSLAAEDENTKKLTAMVNTFLIPNSKTGMLDASKIMQLSKLKKDFNDDQFNEGLDIIINAQIRNKNSIYVSGWKNVNIENIDKKVKFRFTV